MRKLFRMQYEPCNGQCYAVDEVLPLAGLTLAQVECLMRQLTAIHEPACGNEHIRYGLDYCEETSIFVGSFAHYGALDLVTGRTLFDTIDRLTQTALAYYDSDAWRTDSARQPGLGHDVCEHGKDEDLRRFMVLHSGLSSAEQATLLERM